MNEGKEQKCDGEDKREKITFEAKHCPSVQEEQNKNKQEGREQKI